MKTKNLEFVWRSSDSFSDGQWDMWVHIMPYHYCTPGECGYDGDLIVSLSTFSKHKTISFRTNLRSTVASSRSTQTPSSRPTASTLSRKARSSLPWPSSGSRLCDTTTCWCRLGATLPTRTVTSLSHMDKLMDYINSNATNIVFLSPFQPTRQT